MSDRLTGKIAIVTGAGSRGPGLGNGKAAAILFAREGARGLCVDQLKERAEETVGIIRSEGGEATAFAADVTRAADCDGMVAEASERWGGLDILHNNVGIESRKDLVETQEDEWDRVMAVDLKSMFLATRAAVPAMEKRGGGVVICVSSIAGMRGHGRTAYASAKAGVIGFVRSVRRPQAPRQRWRSRTQRHPAALCVGPHEPRIDRILATDFTHPTRAGLLPVCSGWVSNYALV